MAHEVPIELWTVIFCQVDYVDVCSAAQVTDLRQCGFSMIS